LVVVAVSGVPRDIAKEGLRMAKLSLDEIIANNEGEIEKLTEHEELMRKKEHEEWRREQRRRRTGAICTT
jgi:hypothetical protein